MATAVPSARAPSNLRPGISRLPSAAPSATPHTPTGQSPSLAFSASSPAFRGGDDDCLVFEFGTRFMRAGVANESAPRCVLGFGPDEQWRVGDYRRWEPEYEANWQQRRRGRPWGESHELWPVDLRNADLGLIEDKIERAMREAYTKYLLTDSKPRRVLLALPSGLPYALLSILLSTFFGNFQCPSVTIVSNPVVAAAAAGLRSALVVDIGWAETVVTAVFEFREVHCSRSVRAGKVLVGEVGKVLARKVWKDQARDDTPGTEDEEVDFTRVVSFEECEEVLARSGWCRGRRNAQEVSASVASSYHTADSMDISERLQSSSITEGNKPANFHSMPFCERAVEIPLRSTAPPMDLSLHFSDLSEPAETALFSQSSGGQPDDDELPVHVLAYRALLAIPLDVRAVCASRIVVTGGGSKVPGVKRRIVDEVAAMVEERGWDPVRGRAAERRKEEMQASSRSRASQGRSAEVRKTGEYTDDADPPAVTPMPGLAEPERDPVVDKIRRDEAKGAKPYVRGSVRGVESLGAWAGASLVGALKIRGVFEVEKDKYLSQGLAGASKEGESSVVPQRASSGPGVARVVAEDRSSWTLGAWA
ncbi:MAG: hypothetical protein M1832_005157 [Thelocarpon impressellum]|nr:MAG: hypothetical protein M1832_005157 [Thelocarpon impressellum]